MVSVEELCTEVRHLLHDCPCSVLLTRCRVQGSSTQEAWLLCLPERLHVIINWTIF